jgi:hypothetical protein
MYIPAATGFARTIGRAIDGNQRRSGRHAPATARQQSISIVEVEIMLLALPP